MDIKDEDLDKILSTINNFDFDFIVDNLIVDCIFKDNNNWFNLDILTGVNHTGLKYIVKPYESTTETL